MPLSAGLMEKFAECVANIESSAERFIALYEQACLEIGGQDWREDVVRVIRAVQEDIRPLFMERMPRSTFCAFAHMARIHVLFGIPAVACRYVSSRNLPIILKAVREDERAVSMEDKFNAAVEKVRGQQMPVSTAFYVSAPKGHEPENAYCQRVLAAWAEYIESEPVQAIFHTGHGKAVQRLRRIAKLVVEYANA